MTGELADTMPETITRVVAGVDGSEPARHAARWAADEAASRGLPLTLVHAAGVTEAIAPALAPDPDALAGRRPSEGDRLIAATSALVRETHPNLPVDPQVSALAPVPRLTELSGPDTLLVVGTRGHGALVGMLLGSVSRALVKHTRGPLVVVRGPGTERGGYRVVLGVATDPAPRAALFAFDAAQRHGVPLQAVRTRSPLPVSPGVPGAIDLPVVMPAGGGIRTTLPAETEAFAEAAAKAAEHDERLVAAALADARDRYPHVAVETTCVEGDTAMTLTANARDATLVVLGAPHARHHGGFSLSPGHVAGKLLAHSPAPVAIIPETDPDPAAHPAADPDPAAAADARDGTGPTGPAGT